jgi:hypothetical protein
MIGWVGVTELALQMYVRRLLPLNVVGGCLLRLVRMALVSLSPLSCIREKSFVIGLQGY